MYIIILIILLSACTELPQRDRSLNEFTQFHEICLKVWSQSARQCEQFWMNYQYSMAQKHKKEPPKEIAHYYNGVRMYGPIMDIDPMDDNSGWQKIKQQAYQGSIDSINRVSDGMRADWQMAETQRMAAPISFMPPDSAPSWMKR